jgi:predicted Zn-dependent protease
MYRVFAYLFLSLLISLSSCSGKDDTHFNPANCKGDTTFILSSNCEKVKWNSLPVTITFDETITPEIREITVQATNVWEMTTGKDYFTFDDINGRSRESLNIITITPQNRWQGNADIENAKTYWTSQGKSMKQTNIHINERIFQPDERGRTPDLFSIILHEFGHVLGLAHDLENRRSVMFDKLGNDDMIRELNQVDIDRINTLY